MPRHDVGVQSDTDSHFQTMGWNYWYNWTIVLPAELSAAAVLIDFWDKNTSLNSAWVTICLIVVIAINFMGAGTWISHTPCDAPQPLSFSQFGVQVHMARLNLYLLPLKSSQSRVRFLCISFPRLIVHECVST